MRVLEAASSTGTSATMLDRCQHISRTNRELERPGQTRHIVTQRSVDMSEQRNANGPFWSFVWAL